MDDDTAILNIARSMLRTWTQGVLRFDEHVRPVRYVIAPDGRLVMPAMVAMLSTLDTALHIPDEDPDGLQLLVELHEFDPDSAEGAMADRWRIYHGEPEDVRWAVLDIDFARLHGIAIDGEALVVPNPLTDAEPKLCAMVNREHADALAAFVAAARDVTASAPLLVGIDPTGVDVRVDHGMVRVELALGNDEVIAAKSLQEALNVV
ncbi:MAG: hypothetical protein MK074_02445 [Phycisphaerales bacterium]|nr:hypothetical protein [Phycisphaerales bacterium]